MGNIRVRRGLEANRLSFTPGVGEPIFTTDTKKLYIGDGTTPGGILVDMNGEVVVVPVQSVAGRIGDVILVKSDVGLSNVDNTADANKPVSVAAQAALDAKATTAALTSHTENTSNPHSTTKAQVGLPDVDNVSAAALRDRSTHTGTQAIETIAGLALSLGGKQDDLVSGVNIKTVNGESLLGGGDIPIAGGGAGVSSVNGQTGVAVLDADDISDASTTKKFTTAAEIAKLAGIAAGATVNDTDASLKNRANHTGTQASSTISDFNSASDARIAAAAGVSVASLSGGKVPTSQLPALAITDVFVVASQVAQLALTAEEGDIAIRTDQNRSYAHNGGVSGTMADWSELLTPTDAVLSVNGEVGAITLTTDDVSDSGQTNKWATAAEKTKLGHITVTQAVDLDTMESDIAGKQPLDSDLTTIAAANNGAIIAATTASFLTADETKLDGIEALADVTDATNVAAAGAFMKAVDDTDDITVGAANKFATAAEKTKLGFVSVTQAVDLDTIESDTATNNAKVTNATHTGDITGATALTAQPAIITGKTSATVASGDLLLIADISDTNNLKQVTAQSIADLGGGGGGSADYKYWVAIGGYI
jgi:hypothetical protein